MKPSSDQLCEQVMQLFDKLRLVYAEVAEKNGLTKVQLFTVYAISQAGGEVTMNHLARQLNCDASNVTGIVDRLLARKLLTRDESSRDRRMKILKLTATGTELITGLRSALPDRLGCNRLTTAERTELCSALHKMCTNSND